MRLHQHTITWTQLINQASTHKLIFTFGLSWFYALCSQVILPLPFNLIPLSLQPLPLIFCTELFGWQAVHAYLLYLMQGTLGAPFFSRFGNGLTHLLGPTGGYLFGFLGAMIFIATSKQNSHSRVLRLVRYWFATMIIFCCGLTQLAWFVSPNNLFSLGLYPFILGDFLIKPLLFFLIFDRIKVQQKFNNEK